MATIGRRNVHQMRPSNKEPEWSSICNNVLDQYLDDDDIFGFGSEQRGRSSSDNSVNLFDFSGSSEQSSNQTSGTSPIPSWEPASRPAPEAKQPKAKVPLDFWHKKLRALEQHAAASEQDRSHKLRSTKSHPDFLSLGGFPSPPAIPGSPNDQSFPAQRQKSRNAANGRKASSNQRSVTGSRSVSRGRPTGVSKPPAAGIAGTTPATVRKPSASPSKMMTPSRYRAGFKNVWADRIESSPKKYELRLPSSTFPDSPPPSGNSIHDSFAAFGSPATYSVVPGCDAQVSPLARSFQQTRIHTPLDSPLLSPGSHVGAEYFEPPPTTNPYATQTLPLNDTAPLYPERTDSLAAVNKIQTFDFGFSNSPDNNDPWANTSSYAESSSALYATDNAFRNHDPFGTTLDHNTTSASSSLDLGLCDPNQLNYQANSTLPPAATYQNYNELASPYYVPSLPNGLPNTAYRQRTTSGSPPPIPQTDTRSRRGSASRQTSRHHRRTKSTNSTTRQQPSNADKGGFVNFTPQDHNKILSGVAPSGSSKTKARREKEALDKRRRLSQAAYAAVMAAGGSMEQLTKAGLVGDLAAY